LREYDVVKIDTSEEKMADLLKLMCVLAHPDDESFGMGGMLARYAAEGVATYLVTATGGELGWNGDPAENPGPAALRELRSHELGAAAHVLGIREVSLLGYHDGELDQVEPGAAIAQIAAHIRRVRPQVVVTFDPFGVYGHPDHVAISQLTTAAIVAAAAQSQPEDESGLDSWQPHQVAKLYYLSFTPALLAAYQSAMGDLVMSVDGGRREAVGWAPWSITAQIDAADHWRQVQQAVECHRSQLPKDGRLERLSEAQQRALWSRQTFYRAFSFVNNGRTPETDLFAGLRNNEEKP
jgi:LmbE family N-acetylglucosaminyl deacetylase